MYSAAEKAKVKDERIERKEGETRNATYTKQTADTNTNNIKRPINISYTYATNVAKVVVANRYIQNPPYLNGLLKLTSKFTRSVLSYDTYRY